MEKKKILEENIKGSVLGELFLRCLLDIQLSMLSMQLDIGGQFRREVYRWQLKP